jgi:hypothetical protein
VKGEVQVFGADEQDALAIDVLHWVRLAQHVLDEERVPPDAELSLIFVGEDTITDLNEHFLEGVGPTDVLAFPLDDEPLPRGRQPDEGGRGPGTPAEDDDARRSRAARPPRSGGPSTTSSRCSSCTACSTSSTTTTRSRTTRRGCASASRSSSPGSRRCVPPGRADGDR